MVLGGTVNKEIAALISKHGGRAVGITGKDDEFLLAERMAPVRPKADSDAGPVDLGRVGTIKHTNPELVEQLIANGFVPVIASIAVDREGHSLNVNADTAAGSIAAALRAAKLVLMTDVEGVKDKDGRMLSSLTAPEAEAMIESGVIAGGMIPKVRCALEAVAEGVAKVHVIDGRRRHALLLEIFTDSGVGTEIQRAREA
jgi:acetylglutamate kinase